MSALMDLFDGELERFRQDCESEQLRVDFLRASYPQRIVIEGMEVWQQQSMDGIEPTKKKNMKVVVCGDVNGMVNLTDVTMPKKELTKLIGKAEKLLELYLHAFCQDRMLATKEAQTD